MAAWRDVVEVKAEEEINLKFDNVGEQLASQQGLAAWRDVVEVKAEEEINLKFDNIVERLG